MTIASEISRLQTAKADMKTAIVNKWVSVADSVSLSNYCDCINAIQAWGCYPYMLDAIIIWWGGGWWGACGVRAWWWWGAGWVKYFYRTGFCATCYCITIWQWWAGWTSWCDWCDWCPTNFGGFVVKGWWWGGKWTSVWHDWGSWWGGWMFTASLNYIAGWSTYCNVATIPRAWHDGGAAVYYRCSLACYAWWWWGACCMWGTSNTNAPQKCWVGWKWMWMWWWAWSSVFPNMYVSTWWGGGAQCTISSVPSSCPWGNGGTCTTKCGWNATSYWSWWWWAWSGCGSNNTCPWWNWCNWAVAIKYPKDWSYWFTCATWWTVTETSTCVYHLFTSNWTFTIVS